MGSQGLGGPAQELAWHRRHLEQRVIRSPELWMVGPKTMPAWPSETLDTGSGLCPLGLSQTLKVDGEQEGGWFVADVGRTLSRERFGELGSQAWIVPISRLPARRGHGGRVFGPAIFIRAVQAGEAGGGRVSPFEPGARCHQGLEGWGQ